MTELTSEQLLRNYLRGAITARELLCRLTSANVESVFEQLSEEDRQTIFRIVKNAPVGEDEWCKLRLVQAGGWCNVTKQQYDEYMQIEKEKFRTGVEAVRSLFGMAR